MSLTSQQDVPGGGGDGVIGEETAPSADTTPVDERRRRAFHDLSDLIGFIEARIVQGEGIEEHKQVI